MKRKREFFGNGENGSSLMMIPGVGKSIAQDLRNIGILTINDLKGKDPMQLYTQSNSFAGMVQDDCLLYVFRCAVYFAEETTPEPEKLKWWKWERAAKHHHRLLISYADLLPG